MQDIKVLLKFDYQGDTGFPVIPPVALVTEINPNDQKAVFKECGWLSAWGKEITAIDLSQNGGNALIGEWMFARKEVRWGFHPHSPNTRVVDEIEIHLDSLHYGNSPIIVSFALDTMRVAIAVLKTDPFSGPGAPSQNVIKNVSIPWPHNGAWATHPGFQKGHPITAFSPVKTVVDVAVHCEAAEGYEISFMAFETGGNAVVSSAPNNPLLESSVPVRNPYSAVALAFDKGNRDGLFQFGSAPVASYQRKSKGLNAVPSASTPDPAPARIKFVAPDGLDMPTPPDGCKFAMNVRGVVLMEKSGDLYFPHEVWDLPQLDADAKVLYESKSDDYLLKEAKKVRDLFDFCESTANGISLNYRVLREFEP